MPPLCRLVWVGRRPNRNLLAGLYSFQIAMQQPARILLHVNLALEVEPVAQLHEFVRITRITILAAEFASAVWIDGPLERDPGRVATTQQATRFERQIFNVVPIADSCAMCRQARDSYQRRSKWFEGREISSHIRIPFAREIIANTALTCQMQRILFRRSSWRGRRLEDLRVHCRIHFDVADLVAARDLPVLFDGPLIRQR